ncbi:TIGR01244 family phosphatase [Sulfitobacter sp. SK012]|uniref:beta-lactamase hydrolase domain-containing protein n=1 Tax=Sulfitobacter sp. SK012 TaxID=1389005 RepID=UPI000E0A9D67|nr:sulfur transferase domain-containing protein [Sulfitobacter sp. SK012]AXI45246.1 TIGR01244 family phosphatase [Sulfitobacter sp. SK012]
MNVDHLSPQLATCGQVTTDDIALIHATGVKTLICNRPDGEDLAQPLFETVQTTAHLAGLHTIYFPISATGPSHGDFKKIADIVATCPKPILAYCDTGARSKALLSSVLEGNSNSKGS